MLLCTRFIVALGVPILQYHVTWRKKHVYEVPATTNRY